MIEKLGVYFITDSSYGKHEELAEKALKGGIKAIQLREKAMTTKELYRVAKNLRKLTHDYDALLFINDRLDVAIAADADGVHVGQEDLPPESFRDSFDGIIGVSAHTAEEAMSAEPFADYLGVGPVFSTTTKKDAKEPLGISGLREIVNSTILPVIAIGGINHNNVREVLVTGVAGVAVVSAIASAINIEDAARKLLEIVSER